MTEFIIKAFVKNSENTKDSAVRRSVGTLSGVIGIVCNLLLCGIKITAGVLAKSMSIIGDGLNNLSDMGSSLITMLGFKLSGKPADKDHPFGHGRLEYMSAFIVSVLILIVGFELLINSVKSLVSGEKQPFYGTYAIVSLVISLAIKFFLFFFNRKCGKLISSDALRATAQDSINDCFTTLAILVSVVITRVFSVSFNLDAIMATAVAFYILWAGFSSAKDTVSNLLGKPPEKELIKEIESTVMSFSEFLGIHDLIVHDYGPGRVFASIHVEVPQNVDIVECHEKIDLCEKVVFEKTGVQLVIHMDPIDTDNEQVNKAKEQMLKIIKSIDPRFTLHDFRMTPKSGERTNLIFDVVLPADFTGSTTALHEAINKKAKETDETFSTVITFDRDYTG